MTLIQCQKDEISTEIIKNELIEDQENVSFLVTVVDESGALVKDARLLIEDGAAEYYADEHGIINLQGIKVKDLGTRVTVDQKDYHTQVKMLTGRSGTVKTMKIVLMKKSEGVNENTGELVNIDGGGRLQIPTILIDQSGNDYTGEVNIESHYFDPDDNDMLQEAPGNMIGINSENEYSVLGTFGMYLIELSDPNNGTELRLKENYPATIYFPIADSQNSDLPESVPLWSFDEDSGFWNYEGDALLIDDMFVAEVSHFSFWNCDLPYVFVPFCATFVDEFQNVFVGLKVEFKLNSQRFGLDWTDSDGQICGKVPKGKTITIYYTFDGITELSMDIGPFESAALSEIIVLEGPVYISGIAVDCQMNPITNGYGIWSTGNYIKPIVIQPDGAFVYWDTNENHTLRLVDLESNTFVELQVEATSENLDLEKVVVCNEIMESLITGTVMLDEDEDGVSDVIIEGVVVEVKNKATGLIDYTTTTGEDGTYAVQVIPNIEYELSVLSPLGMKTAYHGDLTPDDNSEIENWDDRTRQGFLAVINEVSEVDADNDFQLINNGLGTISGKVTIDIDGDLIGDEPKSNFLLKIYSFTEGTEESIDVFTNDLGEFSIEVDNFIGVIRTYSNTLVDFDESPDPDGDDSSLGSNGWIPIRLTSGEFDSDNNFIFGNGGSICGSVYEDTDNDDVGDTPLEGFTITLWYVSTGESETTTTDENGAYCFFNLAAGEYTVIEQDESEIDEDLVDVYDGDETPEDIDDATDSLNDDEIEVTLDEGEDDADNNFVEEQLGSLSGNITLDTDGDGLGDDQVEGLTINLSTSWGAIISAIVSDENGNYVFEDLEPGDYTVSIGDLTGFVSVSDNDEMPDGDFSDNDTTVDNMITIGLIPGEDDGGNNFVLRNE